MKAISRQTARRIQAAVYRSGSHSEPFIVAERVPASGACRCSACGRVIHRGEVKISAKVRGFTLSLHIACDEGGEA